MAQPIAVAMPATPTQPAIAAIKWMTPQPVLGTEAGGFTPWLAQNLDVLAASLGVEDLELVSTEVDVAGKRLDILAAVGADEDGQTIAVAVEAQYGTSDHDHLGKLVTYAAGVSATHDRVLAVWLVDTVHPAHQAAIELLNRETSDRLGFVLGRVRFVSTGANSYAVDVEIDAEPNEFLRAQRDQTQTPPNPKRHQFLTEVLDKARQPLKEAGFKTISGSQAQGYSANITWPGDGRWRINVRSGDAKDGFRAYVYVNGEASTEANEAILAELATHAELVAAAVAQHDAELDWNYHTTNKHAKKAALGLCRWPGFGYDSDPAGAAERLIAFGRGVAAAAEAAGL